MKISSMTTSLLVAVLAVPRPSTFVNGFMTGQQRSFYSRSRLLLGAATTDTTKLPIMAEEDVMAQKKHGTSEKPVMKDLRWNCDFQVADRICNFNRHYAEYAGYWTTTEFLDDIKTRSNPEEPIEFFDSVTGELLFTAPIGRSMKDFIVESQSHGWPSFRDEGEKEEMTCVCLYLYLFMGRFIRRGVVVCWCLCLETRLIQKLG
eukprot:CAMPEP_0202473876 /NCGR_PEP_ID=MMETSP1360-20130828/92081_1 /ASSEMBLY_ACC=CAM_ASM_000848 /TAXON_ID=515479 /ORGANISM="Licmophora paradoxa, Strain CCMP2313" /LENGTH=203 /DNA_ID=CAMNT_0049100959 /DNA_START=54 /DNA_END=665 /DNA_ORIENTATION=-